MVNRIWLVLFAVLICLFAFIFLSIRQPLTDSSSSGTSGQPAKPKLVDLHPLMTSAPVVAKSSGIDFKRWLLTTPEPYRTEYQRLNDDLYGFIRFSSAQEFDKWQQQGLPTIEDLEFINRFQAEEIGVLMFGRSVEDHFAQRTNPEVAAGTFRALGLLKAIRHLEMVIKFYKPEFNLKNNGNKPFGFTDEKTPEQVRTALNSMMYAQAVIRDNSAFESLARLKFEIFLANWNQGSDQALTPLAIDALVNISLKYSKTHVKQWLQQNYPEAVPAVEQALKKQLEK